MTRGREHGRARYVGSLLAALAMSCQLLVPDDDDLRGARPQVTLPRTDASADATTGPAPNEGDASGDASSDGPLRPDASVDGPPAPAVVKRWDFSEGCAGFTPIGAAQLSTVTDRPRSAPAACRFCNPTGRSELVAPAPSGLRDGNLTFEVFARTDEATSVPFGLAIVSAELRPTTNATATDTYTSARLTAFFVEDEPTTFRITLASPGCIVLDDATLTQ